jgi:hypothetical protein
MIIMKSNQNFGQAVEALKEGKMASRDGWNGKGLFVFMQVPSTIQEEIVPKMQSLPQAVKDEFQRQFDHHRAKVQANIPSMKVDAIPVNCLHYSNQLALVQGKVDGIHITSWSPSTSDSLANDWNILD